VHRRVAAVVAGDLAVPHHRLAVEHPDRLRADVEARPLPVSHDVGGLDLDLAEVVLFLESGHLEDDAGVVHGQGAGGQPVGQGQRVHERHSTADPAETHPNMLGYTLPGSPVHGALRRHHYGIRVRAGRLPTL
jgi:hypothetical protein